MTDDDAITLRAYIQDRLQDMNIHIQRDLDELRASLEKLWGTYSASRDKYVTIDALQTTLKQQFGHVDTLGKQITENIDYRFQSIEKATSIATVAIDHRLESMNEFREQIHQQQLTFLPKGEYEAKHQDVLTRLETLSSALRDAREQHHAFFTHSDHDSYAKEVTLRFEAAENSRDAIVARVEHLEKDYANLQGRIWALGIGMTFMTVAIATVIHFIPT